MPGPMVKLDRQGSQAIRESYYDTQKHRVGSFSNELRTASKLAT